MGPPSTKEHVGNVDKFDSIKEAIESNVEIKDKNIERKKLYADIVIHRNKIQHDVRMEIILDQQYKNDYGRPNLYSSYDNVSTQSCCKPSNIWDDVTTQV